MSARAGSVPGFVSTFLLGALTLSCGRPPIEIKPGESSAAASPANQNAGTTSQGNTQTAQASDQGGNSSTQGTTTSGGAGNASSGDPLPQPPNGGQSTGSENTENMVDSSENMATAGANTGQMEPDTSAEDQMQEPPEPRGPTPPQDGANFPFPQNRAVGGCVLPTNNKNSDVIAAFEKWKADTVTTDGANGGTRIKRLDSDPGLEIGSTVSEGIAYGMLIAVYMNDQELFDGLWRYEQQWLDEAGLMHWYINAAGTDVLGGGAASDADEDMAWALVMADRQWGGAGSLGSNYIDIARDMIDKIWQHEVMDGKLLRPGDGWGDWSSVNISYFAPSYYRVFAEVSGNQGWNDVAQTSYDTMQNSLNGDNGNMDNGLVPAWATSDGVPNNGVWQDGSAPTNYQYDSCRTPFRIGIDYCMYGEQQAYDYVQKTSGFFSGVGVANIVDGYELNGTPKPQFSQGPPPVGQSAAFIGPAAVGAMTNADYQDFLDEAYTAVAGLNLLVGGAYYDESWTVLSLLMMTGNFLDYTKLEPATP